MARKKQTNAWALPLHIAIGAAPTPIPDLESEIRLLKPALLYGDKVTLVSPKAALVGGLLDIASLDTESIMKLIVEVAPIVASDDADKLAAGVADYRRERKRRGKTRDEILKVIRAEQQMRQMFQSEMLPALSDIARTSGANELAPAIIAGLLDVSPLVTPGGHSSIRKLFGGDTDDFADDVVSSYVEQVTKLVSKRGTYPLFDDQTGSLLAMGVREGVFEIPAGADNRARQIHAAARFMERLPAFENASITEILDIRKELGEPLVRFRAAIIEIGDLVKASPHEDEFHTQIDELYLARIAPALLEIHVRIRDNQYLHRLVGTLAPELGKFSGAALTAVIAHMTEIPQLVAGVPTEALAGGAAVTSLAKWVAQEASAKASESRNIERQDLYFLYRVDELLG